MISPLQICQLIQDSQIGTSIRESNYVFPFVNTLHVLGLAVSVGTIVWFDLRALGLNMRDRAVSEVFDQVKHWTLGGFIVMFVTGALMFWSHAAFCYVNGFFRIKMIGLALAGLNIMYFHFKTQRGMAAWDNAPVPPLEVRMAGLLSIMLWAGIIAAGRLMAYTFTAEAL
jgi:hypothetical protein